MLGENDIVCGGNRMYHYHSGNIRFRRLIERNLDNYMSESKSGRTAMISKIVDTIRKTSVAGGFVQKDPLEGRFVAVSDRHAREKTSQAFRDALRDQYRFSYSTNTKKQRKALRNMGTYEVLNEKRFETTMKQLSNCVEKVVAIGKPQSDDYTNVSSKAEIDETGKYQQKTLDNLKQIPVRLFLSSFVSNSVNVSEEYIDKDKILVPNAFYQSSSYDVLLSEQHVISICQRDRVNNDEVLTARELCNFFVRDDSVVSSERNMNNLRDFVDTMCFKL